MNPHQKPQEDVVGNAPKAADAIESLTRRVVFAKPTMLTSEHLAAFDAGKPVPGAVDEPKLIGALMGGDDAYARGYEAGRRDMREAAGNVAEVLAIGARENWEMGYRPAHNHGAEEAANFIATAIHALPTEPLVGEVETKAKYKTYRGDEPYPFLDEPPFELK